MSPRTFSPTIACRAKPRLRGSVTATISITAESMSLETRWRPAASDRRTDLPMAESDCPLAPGGLGQAHGLAAGRIRLPPVVLQLADDRLRPLVEVAPAGAAAIGQALVHSSPPWCASQPNLPAILWICVAAHAESVESGK